MDLLAISFVRRTLGSRWSPISARIAGLLAFAPLVAGGLGITAEDPSFAKMLRNTNLANLLVWSYWWPLIVLGSVVLGRVWCTACPVELLSVLASRFGLRLRMPRALKAGWVITIAYAVILLAWIPI